MNAHVAPILLPAWSDRAGVRVRGPRRLGWRRGRRLVAVALAVMALATPARAAASGDGLRQQDELWWVSTRQVDGVAGDAAPPGLRVERLEPGCGWRESSVDDLLRSGARDATLLVFVHGNRMPGDQSRREGRQVYAQLAACTDDQTPVRFVIWSWPSAALRGPLRDARIKAQRTEIEGYHLGWFLAQLPRTQRVSVLGYSLGARIATGALHLCGGGELAGRTLPHPPSQPLPVHVALLAAALPNTWLRPGAYHQCALQQTDCLLNLFNRCDPVLKRYHWLTKGSRATALGFSGMRAVDLGAARAKIDQCDVSSSVQKSHDLEKYLGDSCVRRRLADALFWHRAPAGDTLAGLSSP